MEAVRRGSIFTVTSGVEWFAPAGTPPSKTLGGSTVFAHNIAWACSAVHWTFAGVSRVPSTVAIATALPGKTLGDSAIFAHNFTVACFPDSIFRRTTICVYSVAPLSMPVFMGAAAPAVAIV